MLIYIHSFPASSNPYFSLIALLIKSRYEKVFSSSTEKTLASLSNSSFHSFLWVKLCLFECSLFTSYLHIQYTNIFKISQVLFEIIMPIHPRGKPRVFLAVLYNPVIKRNKS